MRGAGISPDESDQREVGAIAISATLTVTIELKLLFLGVRGSLCVGCIGAVFGRRVLLVCVLVAVKLLDEQVTDIFTIGIEECPVDWSTGASLSHRHRESIMDQTSSPLTLLIMIMW